MSSSIDGGLHARRYTESPDVSSKGWCGLYEDFHDEISGDAWLVGRTTLSRRGNRSPQPMPPLSRVRIISPAATQLILLSRSTRGENNTSADPRSAATMASSFWAATQAMNILLNCS